MLNLIRDTPGRVWLKADKVWLVPFDHVTGLLRKMKRGGSTIRIFGPGELLERLSERERRIGLLPPLMFELDYAAWVQVRVEVVVRVVARGWTAARGHVVQLGADPLRVELRVVGSVPQS